MDDITEQYNKAAGFQDVAPAGDDPAEARYLAAAGRPEWANDAIPAEKRAADFLKVHARAADIRGGPDEKRVFGRPYSYDAAAEQKAEGDVLEKAKRQFPGMDPDALRKQFQLERAHARQAGQGEDTIEYLARSVMPLRSIGNANRTDQYRRAVNAFNDGKATPDQLEVIARYERLQKIEGGEDALASAGRSVAGVPGMLAEAYVGGGAVRGLGLTGAGLAPAAGRLGVQTAAMPSMYLEQGAQNQLANPDEGAFKSYAPAYGLGLVQTAVLGQLSGRLGGVPTVAGRLGARTGLGLAEMQGADVATTGFDRTVKEVTGKSLGLDTKWGTMGALVRDDPDAWKHAFAQVVTFAAFAALHGNESPAPAEGPGRGLMRVSPERAKTRPSDEVFSSWTDMLNHMQEKGYTKAEAAKATKDIFSTFDSLFKRNPNAGPKEAREMFKDMEPGPIRDFAEKLADQLPTQTTGQARPGTPELPSRIKALPAAEKALVEATPERQITHGAEFEATAGPDSSKTAPSVAPVETRQDARPAPDRANAGQPELKNHGPLREVLAKAFPDAKVEDLGDKGLAVGRGDRFLHLKFDPATKRAEVAFGFADAKANENLALGRSLSKGAVDLGRDLVKVAHGLRDAGVGVRFEAEPRRAAAFGRVLEKAGFSLKSATGSGETRRFEFDPVLQSRKLGAPQVPAPRVLAKKRVLGEPVEPETGLKRTAVMEPPEKPRDPKAEFDAAAIRAGLNGREKYVLAERLKPEARSHQQIAQDPAMTRKGMPYTRQQVSNLEKSAREKMVRAGVDLPGFDPGQSVAKGVHAKDKAEREIEDVAKGNLVSLPNAKADPAAPAKVVRKARETAKAITEHDALTDLFEKEQTDARKAGRELSAERLDFFEREALRIIAKAEGLPAPAAPAAPEAPRAPRRAPDARPPEQAAAPVEESEAAMKKRHKEEDAATRNPEGMPKELLPPKRIFGESDWSHAERDIKQAGAQTFGDYIRKSGGIDPDSMGPGELQTWKEAGLQELFKDRRGRTKGAGGSGLDRMSDMKGKQAIDELADHFHGNDPIFGQKLETKGSEHGEETLLEAVRNHRILDGEDKWLAVEAARKDWHEGQEHAAGGEQPKTEKPFAELTDEEMERAEREEPDEFAGTNFLFGANAKGRPGKIVLPSWDDLKKSNVGRAIRVAADEWYKLRGGQFPRMDALSKPVADHAAALISAQAFAHAAAKFLKRAVYGGLSKQQAARFYTTHAEMRLEYMRLSGKPAAGTLIGPDSPLKSAAEYQATVRDPAFRAYLDRWKKFVVPIMNEHYWDAMGLPHGTPVPTTTQIPGIPINFVRLDPGQTSPTAVGSGGKTIKPGNVTQKRFGFNKAASGEHQYETDPEKAIETVFRKGAEAAGRANLDREMVARGVAQWGRPGAPVPTLPDGTRMKLVRHVAPEPGTQVAPPRARDLFVHPEVLEEYHDAVGVGTRFRLPVITPALQGFTRAAIASTVEASFHSATLAGKMLHPYVLRNTVRTLFEALKPLVRGKLPRLSENQLERLMEMAGGGMTKDRGFESGFLVPAKALEKFPWLGKLDPTRWGAAFLDTVDDVVRLAANRAFEQMADKGLVKNTAQNERDFLNDLGNYKEKSQSMIVRVLRGTGIGPFATAGTSSQVNAVRSLWLSPGVTASSSVAAARLRLHVGLKLAATMGAAALVNWLIWGKPEGDDHTPIGAIKTGDRDGRTYYVDPLRELRVRRGLNATGLSAMMEDEKLGVNDRTKVHDARMAWQHSLLHPAVGPGVQFGVIGTTGHNALGQRVAGLPENEGSVEWENFKAAVKNVNPSLAALMGADKAGLKEHKPLFPLATEESVAGGGPKLFAPYLMSRKQMDPGVLKLLKEKEASPHKEEVIREAKK